MQDEDCQEKADIHSAGSVTGYRNHAGQRIGSKEQFF